MFETYLPKVSQMTGEQIDAIFSMLPEAALPRTVFGATCRDLEEGHILRIVGHYENSYTR